MKDLPDSRFDVPFTVTLTPLTNRMDLAHARATRCGASPVLLKKETTMVTVAITAVTSMVHIMINVDRITDFFIVNFV